MHPQNPQNPGTSENKFRPGEGSSAPGGKHRKSYERYGNYGLVDAGAGPDKGPAVSPRGQGGQGQIT